MCRWVTYCIIAIGTSGIYAKYASSDTITGNVLSTHDIRAILWLETAFQGQIHSS